MAFKMLQVLPTGEFPFKIKGRTVMVDIGECVIHLPLVVICSCMRCKHFNDRVKTDNVCSAFPKGIPEEILTNEVDHTQPYEGDNGIQFGPVKSSQ